MKTFRRLSRFFTDTLTGRTLVFASLPLLLLIVAFWEGDHQPPIVDVQMHYNEDAWPVFPARAIVNTMEDLAVIRAVVSSTPNQGTFTLLQQGPKHVIPFFQPYRTRSDRDHWPYHTDLIPWIESELRNWEYRGIGELHVSVEQLDAPVLRRVVALAVEHNLPINLHAEADALEALIALEPRLKILWAHAGMTAGPEVVGRLLERHPLLYAELSHRIDVVPEGVLAPPWRELFLRFPDRFMVGTGTYSNEYWYQFRYSLGAIRQWLAELPPDVAERIAFRNALNFFDSSPPRAAAQGAKGTNK